MAHRYQREHAALGSTVFLTIVTGKGSDDAATVLARLIDAIDTFERRFSRFREDSELTTFNRQAGKRTPITQGFQRLLETAQTYTMRTEGLYNPFILPALQRAGYQSSWPTPEKPTTIDFRSRTVASGAALRIGEGWARIPADTALDFGGIGKGYLLDQLADMLAPEALDGYWLSLGGDIICSGHDLAGAAWHIAVQDALQSERSIRSLIHTQPDRSAIATSGTTKRRGPAWHHIIDPRTGAPAETDVLTATVVSDSGTAADVYAKAIVIGGPELARQYKQAGYIRSCIVQATGRPVVEV